MNIRIRWTRTTTLFVAIGISCLGGSLALWQHLTNPPQPWLVRWQVMQYLRKYAAYRDFQIDFPFPSKAEMAQGPKNSKSKGPAKGSRTGADFETLKREYLTLKTALVVQERDMASSEADLNRRKPQLDELTRRLSQSSNVVMRSSFVQSNLTVLQSRVDELEKSVARRRVEIAGKEQQLAPIVSDLWEFQRGWAAAGPVGEVSGTNDLAQARTKLAHEMRKKLDDAKTYAAIYRLIGQELWVAGRLLESANPAHQRTALGVAWQACEHAQSDAQNGWLAARICEGYIWPLLEVANDSNRRSILNLEYLARQCADVFRENDESANVLRNYQLVLDRADNPYQVDYAHSQIAMVHEQMGQYQEALHSLKSIKATNDFSWVIRRIPRLEQMASRSR